MEYKKVLIIFIAISLLITGMAITDLQNSKNINTNSKNIVNETFYKIKQISILKLNIDNKTIYLYDNNFSIIKNPEILSVLNNSNIQPLFSIQSFSTEQTYINIQTYLDVNLKSNIPMSQMWFYNNGDEYFTTGIAHYYNNNKSCQMNGLFEIGQQSTLEILSTQTLYNLSLTFSNTYLNWFDVNDGVVSSSGNIFLDNFTFSHLGFVNLISNDSILNTVLFSSTGLYTVNFPFKFLGNLTITGNKNITENNINGSYNVLLKNGTYFYQDKYIMDNKTYYLNGTINILGSNVNVYLNYGQSFLFNITYISWIIMLLISELILLFVLKNYFLMLIDAIGFILIGIIYGLGFNFIGYLLMIVLFISIYLSYIISIKSGD